MAQRTDYLPISDYGLIGDGHTAALVSSQGSIDWLCWPRFDSPALFARILDHDEGGSWTIEPFAAYKASHRYVPETNVLETTFTTTNGCIRTYDLMMIEPLATPGYAPGPRGILRIVEGVEGEVEIESICMPRPNYGQRLPTFDVHPDGVDFDQLMLRGPVSWQLDKDNAAVRCRTIVRAGERLAFTLQPHDESTTAAAIDPFHELDTAIELWQRYAHRCSYEGPYRDMVMRSALTLKLLIDRPTGAIVAAPTTSLPEEIGGVRNWDYRFTWIRDASFTLYALLLAGYEDEDDPFFAWIVRTVKVMGTGIKILYPISADAQIEEEVLEHLDGYRDSPPVRIGNGAADQIQLDIYGEVLDALHFAWKVGQYNPQTVWKEFRPLVDWVVDNWQQPESGIWEIRGGLRNFVYGKVMCWVALDRAIDMAESIGLEGDIERWRLERDRIRAAVFEHGWSDKLGAFKQSFEDELLDAANLMLPVVGFIEGDDPRMISTIDATLRHLVANDLCYRYLDAPDGVPGGEATFVLCTFWLVDALILAGREDEAQRLFERTLNRATTLGLFAEEIDPATGAHLGNFPQAFSHIGVINAAVSLAHVEQVGRLHPRLAALGSLCRTGVSGARRIRSAEPSAHSTTENDTEPCDE